MKMIVHQTPWLFARRVLSSPRVLLWVFLGFVAVAELATSLVSLASGMLAHTLLLFLLLLRSGMSEQGVERRITLALTLAPMIRLLSLSLPLLYIPRLAWYPAVAVPLMVATWLIVRQLKLTRADVGWRPGNLLLQIAIMGGGFGLGYAEYLILKPAPMLPAFSWSAFLIAGLTLTLSTGLVEEVIFRGVLQSLALPALGRSALLYVSLLFAVLHIGYLSVIDVVFVFAVGLLFAYVVKWGGSILGVSLAHGLTNITLFLIMPTLAQQPERVATLLTWLIWGCSAVSIVAIDIIMLRAVLKRTSAPVVTAPALTSSMRAMRHAAGLSYIEIAERTGVPMRVIFEIEHGLRPMQLDQVAPIAKLFGVAPQQLAA